MGAIKGKRAIFWNMLICFFISVICIVFTLISITSINTSIEQLTPLRVERHLIIDDSGRFVDVSDGHEIDDSIDNSTNVAVYEGEQVVKSLICLRRTYFVFIGLVVIDWFVFIAFGKNAICGKKLFFLLSDISFLIIIMVELVLNYIYVFRY